MADPDFTAPQDVGQGDRRTSSAAQDTSKAGSSSQRDCSPVKGSAGDATTALSTGTGGQGHGDDDGDDDDEEKRKKRRHPGERDPPSDAASRDASSRRPQPRRPQPDGDDDDSDDDIELIEDSPMKADSDVSDDMTDESDNDATHYCKQRRVYAEADHSRSKDAFYGRYDTIVETAKGPQVRPAVQPTVPLPDVLQEVRSPGDKDRRVSGRPLSAGQIKMYILNGRPTPGRHDSRHNHNGRILLIHGSVTTPTRA